MDEQKQKLIERIKQSQNILVTVSANPSVDQLAAAIGLTLALNKMDKHGTAVFSGQAPSTIEFLKPEETLEKNTDSLRDFIIALDKSKADKLRYKVEDQVVRIFITPYKTSLSEKDLNFSQGDFNVDVVIALGVTEQQDLDAAITAHGRILHDATVASVTNAAQGSLGTINWVDPQASSLSEMVSGLTDGLDKKLLDNQIATALLTGIVAATDRFRNEKTTPKTMSASAALMASGANPQLIATQLETPPPAAEPAVPAQDQGDQTVPSDAEPAPHKEPGTLEINHEGGEPESEEAPAEPEPAPEEPEPQIHVDADGGLHLDGEEPLPKISHVHGVSEGGQPTEGGPSAVKHEMITEPPRMGDAEITANASAEEYEPSTEELTLPTVQGPLLSHTESVLTPPEPDMPGAAAPAPNLPPPPAFQPAPSNWQPPEPPIAPAPAPFTPPAPAPFVPPAPDPVVPPPPFTPPTPAPFVPPAPSVPAPTASAAAITDTTTLSQIEQTVGSPHVHISPDGTLTNSLTPPATPAPSTDADAARRAVEAAFNSSAAPSPALPPINALNAQPLGPDLHAPQPAAPAPVVPNLGFSEPTPGGTPADATLDMPLPSNPFGPGQQLTPPPMPQAPPTSAFPGTPPPAGGTTPPPPVPPPMFPMQ